MDSKTSGKRRVEEVSELEGESIRALTGTEIPEGLDMCFWVLIGGCSEVADERLEAQGVIGIEELFGLKLEIMIINSTEFFIILDEYAPSLLGS